MMLFGCLFCEGLGTFTVHIEADEYCRGGSILGG